MYTHCNQHKVAFANSSTATEEGYNEHDNSNDYQQHRSREKLFINEM